jgi:hypothetical protein
MLNEQEILEYFNRKTDKRGQIADLFKNFEESILPELRVLVQTSTDKKQNIYQLTSCTSLSSANAVTRTFSTKLGTLWEKVAMLAPNVISPEFELGYKIPEIDVIVKYNNKLYYTQLKTQKNTLTGSQSPRTAQEMSIYENSWFVACIDTDCSWTAPKSITRLVGREFWEKIGIDYNVILTLLTNLCQKVEEVVK